MTRCGKTRNAPISTQGMVLASNGMNSRRRLGFAQRWFSQRLGCFWERARAQAMVRRVLRSDGSLVSTRTVPAFLSLCALLLASSACSRRPGTMEVRPEPIAGGAGPQLTASSSTTAPPTAPLAGQLPLLLRPQLETVRAAIEEGDDERAIAALRALIAQHSPLDAAEYNYLLGVLLERSGTTQDATRAFEIASSHESGLRRDAIIHWVRLELRQRNCSRAEVLLAPLVAVSKDQAALAELLARIDLCSRNWGKAVERLRWLVASGSDGKGRPERQLLLAQALLEQLRAGQSQSESSAREVAELVRQAIQPVASVAVLEDAKRILADLLTLPRERAIDLDLSNERATLLEALVEARRWGEAKALSKELLAQLVPTDSGNGLYCRVAFASGRVAAGTSDSKSALDAFEWVSGHCEDEDLAARALFLAAGRRLAAKDRARAIMAYAELERRFPVHRLADDARLKQAILYRAMGADARFTSLLDTIYDVYPKGDMVPEALFQLALKHMTERDWSEALTILQRTSVIHKALNRVRTTDIERNEYFLARALVATGHTDAGIELLRNLVIRKPLSYYMILAYSTLLRLRSDLATLALQSVVETPSTKLELERVTTAAEREIVDRIALLLGVGDLPAAELELNEPRARQIGQTAALSIAATLANVGATNSALSLVKKLGIDCRDRWPNGAWRELWVQAYPQPHQDLVRRESSRTSVPASLIYAIMREESEFDPKAVSVANAYGLMQLIVPTARRVASELGLIATARSLLKPSVNIALGTSVLGQLMDRFERQVPLVAAGYNAGPGRPIRWLREYPGIDADLWVELIEYPETRNYVKRVLESYATYRWLYVEDEPLTSRIDVIPETWSSGRAANPAAQ